MNPRGSPLRHRRLEQQALHALQGRVAELERAAARPAPERGAWARFLAYMGSALPQLFTGLVVLLVGYGLKDSVDLALRQQQLQLSFVTAMKAGLEEMAREQAPLSAVQQAATVLAAFGRPAILPLINELRGGGNRTVGAEAGLAALALTEPAEVCRLLQRSLHRSAQLFNNQGYGAAVRSLGAAGCAEARELLRAHLQRAEQTLAAQQLALNEQRAPPEVPWLNARPTVANVKDLVRDLKTSLSIVEAPAP